MVRDSRQPPLFDTEGQERRGKSVDERVVPLKRMPSTRHLPSVVIGVVAAVATVVALDHFREQPRSSTPLSQASREAAPSERVVRNVIVEGRGLDRVAELERQMRELQATLDAAKGEPQEEKPRITHEEAIQKMDEAFAAFDRDHERDGADPSWAPQATNNLATGLSTLGEEVGFKVGQTDCKTTTCRATVTFSDYGSAQAKAPRLVEQQFAGLNCTQRMRWQPPADLRAPYSAQLYLDCTELRGGVIEPLEDNDT